MVDKNNLEVVKMKKVLVIGSAVVDVVIHLPHLPEKSEDVHVTSQKMSLGGCAYNASDTIRHFKVPYIPFFPVGTGAYGDFVRNALAERGIRRFGFLKARSSQMALAPARDTQMSARAKRSASSSLIYSY